MKVRNEMKFRVLLTDGYWMQRSMILDSVGKDLWRTYVRHFDMVMVII